MRLAGEFARSGVMMSFSRRISVQTLRAVGSALVEIHGQHDERALVDASTHRRLLDAFAGLEFDFQGHARPPPTAESSTPGSRANR